MHMQCLLLRFEFVSRKPGLDATIQDIVALFVLSSSQLAITCLVV